MVVITKGSMTLTVPKRAYDKMYAPAGWDLKGKEMGHTAKVEIEHTVGSPKEEDATKAEETAEEVESTPDEEEEEIEYVDPEELLEKPVNELDFEELQIVAEYLGIDTKGITQSKKLRNLIKAAQEKK